RARRGSRSRGSCVQRWRYAWAVFRHKSRAYYRKRRVLSKDAAMPLVRSVNALVLAAAVLGSLPAFGEAPPAPPASPECASQPCRASRPISLFVSPGNWLGAYIPQSPYLTSDGHIVIFPGERLTFRFNVSGNALSAPQFVRGELL